MEVLTSVDDARLGAARTAGHFAWVDLVDAGEDELRRLGETLALHPLAIEDTLEWDQRPKLDRYDDHALLVYYSARETPAGSDRMFEPVEVHLHLSEGSMVTVRRGSFAPLDDLRERLSADTRHHAPWFVYQVIDTLTDAYYPVLDSVQDRLAELEADVLARPRDEQLAHIYHLKQDVNALYRRLEAQYGEFPTAAESLPGLGRDARPYLRDVRDHLGQLVGELHRVTVDLTGLADTYFNANANRLNRTATRLTIIGSFFLAWTLVTGFFGQNFKWLTDNIESRADFLVFGVGALAISTLVVGAFLWRRRRDLS